MAFTLNRRLSTLVDSNGQLNTGKIPNDYINGDHVADNVITTAMLHTGFTLPISSLSSIDTDDVTEGSTNLFYTNARVDSHLSGGTGVTYSAGTISIGQAVATTDNVTFNNVTVDGTLTSDDITSTNISVAGNATITGNLTVQGTTTSIDSNTVNIGDNILVLNSDETGTPSQNAGIEIERGTDTNVSLVWDETNDYWTVGSKDFVATNLTGTLSATSVLADGVTATTQSVNDNSTKVATTAYVDAQVTLQDLDFAGDSGTGQVDLDSQTLTVTGGTGITTTASSQ